MENESMEFNLISEKKKESVQVRQFFRVPVFDKQSVQVRIKTKKYFISNISQGGIGIGPDNPPDFKAGEMLTDCELILATASIKGLSGKVVHCSPANEGPLQYGIQWIDLQAGQRHALDEILSRMKTSALENNDRKIGSIQATEI